MVTYGDGVANIDIKTLLRFHQHHGKLATITGVNAQPLRFLNAAGSSPGR